jgi:hypothetical protein
MVLAAIPFGLRGLARRCETVMSQSTDLTPARIPNPRCLFLAGGSAMDRPAALPRHYRGWFSKGGTRGEGDGGVMSDRLVFGGDNGHPCPIYASW